MDLESVIMSEVSQTVKVKYMVSLISEILKEIQIHLSTKQKETHSLRK